MIIDLVNAKEAVADWPRVPSTVVPGANGFADTRRRAVGDAKLRAVD